MYVFFTYLGLLVLVAFIMTVVFRVKQNISERKVHSCLAYFKLTSTVNAAMIFFQLYLQSQRDEIAIFILVVTGIDMGLDFLEMAAGCAALGVNMVYPLDSRESPEVKSTSKNGRELSRSPYPMIPRKGF